MKSVVRILAAATYVAAAGCGGTPTPPTSPTQPTPPAPGGSQTISGREHIGWTQPESNIDGYVFLMYVDNVRNELPQTSCSPSTASTGGFDCDSPLPPLTNGTHTLQLAAAVHEGDSLLEGPKSASLVVNVNGSSSTAAAIRIADASSQRGAAGNQSSPASTLAPSCGLSPWDPTSVLAWTTGGDIGVIEVGTRSMRPLGWHNETADTGWRLESLARRVDPSGSRVFAIFTSGDPDGPALQVVRYREVNGVLGERAVVLREGLAVRPRKAIAAFGPDGALYVSLIASAPSAVAAPFVIRLDPDASSNSGAFAAFVTRGALATAWGIDGHFWILESDANGYLVRAGDADQPAWRGTAAGTPVGLQGLGTVYVPQLGVFFENGPAWLLSAPDATPARVDLGGTAPRQSMLLAAGTAVSCQAAPQLVLSYDAWRE